MSIVPKERRRQIPLRERLLSKTSINLETGCWEWTAHVDHSGYGRMTVNGRGGRLAHRTAYELFVGPIPIGRELDHLCRVRRCVNPAHLEPVTRRENQLRSPITIGTLNAAKTHCPAGHEYNTANTYIRPDDGGRQCRICSRAASDRASRNSKNTVRGTAA